MTCPVNCCSPGKNLKIASISHKSIIQKIFWGLHCIRYLVFMSLCSISYRQEEKKTISMEYCYVFSYGFSYITKSYCVFVWNIFIWKLPLAFMKIADVNVELFTENRIWTPNLIHFYDFMSNKNLILIMLSYLYVWILITKLW